MTHFLRAAGVTAAAGLFIALLFGSAAAQSNQCTVDSDCMLGHECNAGRCRVQCKQQRDCAKGEYCVGVKMQTYMAGMCMPYNATSPDWRPELFKGMNLSGADIASFDMDRADPIACHAQCVLNERCIAWTYVEAGVQGPLPRCWLKNGKPPRTPYSRAVSGFINKRIIIDLSK